MPKQNAAENAEGQQEAGRGRARTLGVSARAENASSADAQRVRADCSGRPSGDYGITKVLIEV